jgi:nicotinate-nucleotide adenylyltransferase
VLFGGTFDPPTLAHRRLVEIARAAIPGAEIVVIPAGQPPHKAHTACSPASLRLEMARLAFQDLDYVRVSDEECRLPGPSFTVETLERHRRELGERELYWLIGSDSLLELPTWRQPERILELAHVLTVARPGFDLAALDRLPGLTSEQRSRLRRGILADAGPPISATEVRQRLGRGEDVGAGVDPRVLAYIAAHRLYGPGPPP